MESALKLAGRFITGVTKPKPASSADTADAPTTDSEPAPAVEAAAI